MQNILVCFGDSFTKGKVLDPGDKDFKTTHNNYPVLLQKKFKNTKVINAGVNDDTTVDALNRIKADVLSKRPTHILVLFGGNDVRIDWFKLILNKFKSPKSKVSLKDYKKNLNSIILLSKKNRICPIFLTLPPIDTNRFLDRLSILFGTSIVSVIKKHRGAERIKGTYDKYNQVIKTVAKKAKINIIDLRKEFTKQPNWRRLISEDGAHPSSKGQKFIAKVIKKHLKVLLT